MKVGSYARSMHVLCGIRPRTILWVLVIMVSQVTYGQNQIAKALLLSGSSHSVQLIDGTFLLDADVGDYCILLRDSFQVSDTAGVVLEITNSLDPLTAFDYALIVPGDTFQFSINNLNIVDEQGGALNQAPLAVGDSIIIGRTPSEILLVHNEDVLSTTPFVSTTDLLHSKVTAQNGLGVEICVVDKLLHLPTSLDTVVIEFVDSMLTVVEGNPLFVCVRKIEGTGPSYFSLPLQLPSDPHFAGYSSHQITSEMDTLCVSIASDPANGLRDTAHMYFLNLVSEAASTIIGPQSALKIQVLDDVPEVDYQVNFLLTDTAIYEGDPVDICLDLTEGNPFNGPAEVEVEIIAGGDPHFGSVSTLQYTFAPGELGPICIQVPSAQANMQIDTRREYIFKITSISGEGLSIGPKGAMRVEIIDDGSIPDKILYAGDLIFTGFDNDIGAGRDAISITNLVPISKGMCFSLSDGVYDETAGEEMWYGGVNPWHGLVRSQLVTYTGDSTLPIGTVICFELPAEGEGAELFASEFKINNTPSTAFDVVNDGLDPDAKIDLSTTGGDVLFLMQGQWRAFPDHAKFFGRVMHGIKIGDSWLPDGGSVASDGQSEVPDDINCFETQACSSTGQCYGYYNCQPAEFITRVDFVEMAGDFDNWITGQGTTANDLSSMACDMQCMIVEEALLQCTAATDLTVDCSDSGFQDSITLWLQSHGGGQVTTGCQLGGPYYTHDYVGLDNNACTPGGTIVNFIATDSCGGRDTCTASIRVINSGNLVMETAARDTVVEYCDSRDARDLWLSDRAGMRVSTPCGTVTWSHQRTNVDHRCQSSGVFEITHTYRFTASDICGNIIQSYAQLVIPYDSPVPITTDPTDLVIACDASDRLSQIATWLDNYGGMEDGFGCHVTDNNLQGQAVSYSHDYTGQLDQSCGSVVVTFTASFGGCGQTISNRTATLSVGPTNSSITLTGGDDITIYCKNPFEDEVDAWIADMAGAVIGGNPCGTIISSYSYTSTDPGGLEPGTPYITSTACGYFTKPKVDFTFTVSDDCGNSAQITKRLYYTSQCPAEVTLSQTDCQTLQASVTNCPTGYSPTYQWRKGESGTSIPGATSSTFQPTESGEYFIRVTCDCWEEESIIFTHPCDNVSVAIEESNNVLTANVSNGSCMQVDNYRWYKDNVLVAQGQSFNSYSVSVPGDYKVEAIFPDCIVSDTYQFCGYQVNFSESCTNTKVDVLFLIDRSGSVGDDASDVYSTVDATIKEIISTSVDVRYAVTHGTEGAVTITIPWRSTYASYTNPTFTGAFLPSATFADLLGLLGGSLSPRSDASLNVVIFSDADHAEFQTNGSYDFAAINNIKSQYGATISFIGFDFDDDDEDEAVGAAIASVGGSYTGPIASGSLEGTGAKPRRYYDMAFTGGSVPNLIDELLTCDLSVALSPAHTISSISWSTVDGDILAGQGTTTITTNAIGTYNASISTSIGCTISAGHTLTTTSARAMQGSTERQRRARVREVNTRTEKSNHEQYLDEIRPDRAIEGRDFFIYPNPTRREFYLAFNSSLDELMEIELTTAAGKLVKKVPVAAEIGGNTVRIDSGDLPAGIYNVRLSASADYASKRIVIIK